MCGKKGAIAIITNRQVEGLPCIVVDDICEAYCRCMPTSGTVSKPRPSP